MIDIGLGHYLTLGAVIFSIGIIGIFLNRKNIIVILMSIELILLAVNINLVSFSMYLGDLSGQVFTLFILTVAAAEAAIGLAIIVVYFRNSGTIRVEEIDKLKGKNGNFDFSITFDSFNYFWIFWKIYWRSKLRNYHKFISINISYFFWTSSL